MLYQSLKLTNGIWVLAELRIQPGNPSFTVRAPAPALPALGCLPPCSRQPLLLSLLPRPGVSLNRCAVAQLGWGPSERDMNEPQNSEPSFQLRLIRLLDKTLNCVTSDLVLKILYSWTPSGGTVGLRPI